MGGGGLATRDTEPYIHALVIINVYMTYDAFCNLQHSILKNARKSVIVNTLVPVEWPCWHPGGVVMIPGFSSSTSSRNM